MSRFPELDPDFQEYVREDIPRLSGGWWRYAGAVHSAAGRVLGARGHLAEGVFTLLARKAAKLPETIGEFLLTASAALTARLVSAGPEIHPASRHR